MNDTFDLWPKLVIASLATWRLTHLLAREDGPFLVMARLRAAAGASWLGQMLDCFNCLSLCVAAPITMWIGALGIGAGQLQSVMVWLALSGAACLCDRLGQPQVMMRVLPDNESSQGDQHELLRTTP